MGKPNDELPEPSSPSLSTPPLTRSPSAVHLDNTSSPVVSGNPTPTFQRYFDDDPAELGDGDLPPLYNDLEHGVSAPPERDPLVPRGTASLTIEPLSRASRGDVVAYMDPRLDIDPDFLMSQVDVLATRPPRPFAVIHGQHVETRRNGDKDESCDVIDFALEIELTNLLFTDASTGASWRELRTAGNFEKVRRGTVFPKRAPGFGGSGGITESGQPSVLEWCHRYCASQAGLKVFTLEHRLEGWDFDALGERLEKLIRDTNYQGTLRVEFPVRGYRADVYNECRTNKWRLTPWICYMFYFTLLFLFTWPWLFFRTKRFETVHVVWPLRRQSDGQYAAMSEDRWYNLWARTIQKAVLSRRQGVLDQGDVRRAEHNQAPGGAIGALHAMNSINQSFGWGGNTNGSTIGNIGRIIKSTRRR